MLKDLDRNVVLMQPGPLPQYKNEHGYSTKKDLSEKILREQFPNVEIYEGNFPTSLDFQAELYNEGLLKMRDCDVVFRLDPDMLFSDEDWKALVNLVRTTDFEAYRMAFAKDSISASRRCTQDVCRS
jgi:hypothetical protein